MKLHHLLPILSFVALAYTTAGWAVDNEGNHAVRGVGIAKCSTFVREIDTNVQEINTNAHNKFLFAGWLNGYLTAWNQLKNNTFEVASWQTLDTLASYLEEYCKRNPEKTFYAATSAMLERLMEHRLEVRSETRVVSNEGKSTVVYEEVLQRVRNKLVEQRYLIDDKEVTSDAFATALMRYQEARNLPRTGIPDQQTLHHLFLAGS